jgi:hypothetical protein
METFMSQGPGRAERAIAAILDQEPDNAFTVEELCRRVYRVNRAEKEHRLSALRAARKLAIRRDTLMWCKSHKLGATVVYFNCDNVMSYVMARLKADSKYYQNNDTRRDKSEASPREELSEEGCTPW